MTTAIVTTQTFTQKLAHQAEITFRSGSTYVVLAIATAVGIFNAMDASQQAALLGTFPFLKGWGGVISAVALFLGTRIKPSNAISTQTAALVQQLERAKLNDWLKKNGVPPLPDESSPTEPVLVPSLPAPPPIYAVPPSPPPTPPEDPGIVALRAIAPEAHDDRLALALKTLRGGF
jgi:hypothetical protein